METHCSVLLCALLIAGAFAGPLNHYAEDSTTKCAKRCPASDKFTYTSGKTYEYNYAADVKTSIPDTTEEHSSLHMTSLVQIEVLSPCDMVLKLTDVSLQDSNPRDYNKRNHVEKAWEYKRALQERPLRFSFVDGKIEDVCPSQDEATWVLNIKRAIISALQNTMHSLKANTRVRETDVAGDCEVEYQVLDHGYGVSKVKKIKDVLGCISGHGHETFFQGVPYQVPSKLQSVPILKTTHECEQEVNSQGLIVKASCLEKHIFRPFSKFHSGAQTEITYMLEFARETDGVRSTESAVLQRSSLVFDYTPSAEEVAKGRREAIQTMGELCSLTTEDIRPEVPSLFSKLVHQMRLLDAENLEAVHTSTARMCDKAEKFYHDAIPMLGSSASVKMIYDLIKSGEVKQCEADMWLTSLSFIPRPTADMLPVVKNLLTTQAANKKAALAVSSLINNYCKLDAACLSQPAVIEIISIFENNLKYNCKAEGDEHETVMMSLKAIGNTGNAAGSIPTLTRCFKNDEAPMDARVAAIDAFRRMPCQATDELYDLFRKESEDAELRIHAYLMLMECPKQIVITKVQDVLQGEQITQVGSFVWTHLTNLMETSSPLKQEIRAVLENEELQTRFNVDKRKFSRNMEWSLFSEMANTGASVESNVIWSSKSYVPRSAMVNLTVDIFGHSVNLLEVGGRVEGMERLLEGVFGPGKESNDVPSRQKRSVIKQSALDIIDRRFKLKTESKPSASYYMKVFGNEIRYEDLHNIDLASMKEKLNYLDWLIELAKEHDYDVTKSLMFLDSTMTFPTSLGLPLKLHATGTSTVNMKVKGKLDMRKMFKWPSTIDIAGQVKPSAAVEVAVEMGVDAFVARTGLVMKNTLHTSTVTDGSVELKDGKVFNMDLNFPKDKMEVFSAESKFFVIHRQESRPQNMITEGRTEKSKCLGGSFVKAFGFEVCGELSLPAFKSEGAPWFPMTGPASAKFYVNKKDTLTGVHVEARYLKEKKKVGETIEITDIAKINFNTPGSRYDREFLIDFNLQRATKTLKLNLKSPWKKMDVEGSLVNTDELKKFTGRALMDERNEYAVTGEVQIDESKGIKEYTPSLEIIVPNKSPMTLGGKLLQKSGKVIVDLAMKNVLKGPVEIRGELGKIDNKNRLKLSADLDFESPDFKLKFDSFHDNNRKGNSISQRVELLWNGPKVKKERFVLSNKIRDQSTEKLLQYSVDSSLESTMWPQYNGQISTDFTKTDKSISGKFEGASGYNHGQTIKVSFGANKNGNLKDAKVAGNLKVEIPTYNVDYEMNLDHKHNKNEVQTNAKLQYGGDKEAVFVADMNRENSRQLKADALIRLQYPGRHMSWEQKVEEKSPHEYHHELKLQLDQYNQVRLTSVYKMEPRHEVEAQLFLPNFRPMTLTAHTNTDPKNIDARAQVTYEDKTFALGTNWLYRRFTNALNTKGGFELVYPGRRIASQGSMDKKGSQYNAQLTTKWDADRDERKMVSISADIRAEKESPAWDIKTEWYPSKFVQVSGSASYKMSGWLHPEKDWHGRMLVATSFPGFEQISKNIKLDQKDDNIQIHVDSSWAPNKKIDADIQFKKLAGWKSITTTGTVTTPFSEFSQGKFNLQYNLDPRRAEINSAVKWNEKQMTLVATGKAIPRRHLFEGSAKFTSPFRGYEEISLDAKHNDDGRVFKTELDATFGREKITGRFNMNHDRQGYYITNNGAMIVRTTFRNYRQSKLTWRHSNTADAWNCQYDMENDMGKGSMKVDAEKKITRANRQLSLKATMSTPWTDDMAADISHTCEIHRWSTKSSSMLRYGTKTIQGSNEMSMEPWESIVQKFKLTTPFRTLRELTVDLDTKQTGGSYNTHNEVKWGPNEKVTVDGFVKVLSLTDLETEGRITTPFRNFERMLVKTSLKEQGQLFVSSMEAEYGNGKKFKLGSQLGIDRVKKIAMDMESECPYMRKAAFDVELTGRLRDFNTEVEISHHKLGGIIKGKMSLDTSNIHDIKGKVNLKTPFQQFDRLRGLISHKKMSAGQFKSDISLDLPKYRTTFNNDITIIGWNDFKTTTQLQYSNKRIELATEFKTEPTIMGKVGWKSPFNKFEEIELNFNHEGGLRNFKSNAELSYSPRDKISANGEFNMVRNSISGSGKFSTPFHEPVSVSFNHNGGLKNFKSSAEISTPQDKIEASGEFSLRQANVRGSGKFHTSRTRPFTFSFNHDGELSQFQNEATVEFGHTRVSGESEFRFSGNTLFAKASAQTPWQKWERLEMKVNHNGPWHNFQNDGELTWSRNKISANSEFRASGNNLVIKANANTPFSDYEALTITVTHNGPWSSFENKADIKFGRKVISGSSSFSKNDDNLNGRAQMTLPSSWMRDVAVNFEHDGKWKNFRNSFTLTFNGQPYKASSDYKLTQKVVKASAKLELPETYSISLLHKGKASNFNNDLTIVYPSGQLMAENDFKLQGTNIEAKSKITTPFRGYEEFSANLNHVGDLQGFRSTANLNTPFTSFTPLSVEVNHNGDLREFRSSARLEGPFRSVSPLSIAVTHKGEYKDMTSTAKLQYAGSEISAEQAYKIENGNIDGSAELITPYSAIQNARLTYKHNGNRNNFKSEMTGNFNRHRMNMNLKHRGTPTDFTTTLNGALNRNRISGTVTHSGDLSRFESSASGSYNSHKLGLTFKHAGDLSSFETTGSGSLNNHRGSMNLKHSGELRRFNTEGSAEYNNRRAAFNVKHTGNYRRINTDVTGEYDGKAISGSVSYSNGRSIEGSANIRTPFTNWEKIDATFKHTGELNNFNSEASVSSGRHRYSGTAAFSNINGAVDASATAVTTIPGYENLKASFKHNGNARRFNSEATAEYNNNKLLGIVNFVNRPAKTEGSVNINLPFRKLRNIAAEFSHRGELRDFSTSGSVKYNSKKIEAEVTQKTIAQEGVIDHVSSASLKTPFEQARDCAVKAEFHKNALAYEGKMEVSHNQEKCLDIDAAYDHKRSARMTMREPHPMQMTASGQREGSTIKSEADINWNTANPENNIRMEMNLKNNKGDRRITIKTIAPRKTYSVSTGYTNDGEKMMHDFEYDPTPGRKFNYGIEMTKSNRGRRSMYDGRVSVNSAAGDLDASFSHTVFAGRRYSTNVRLGARESLVINHELEIAAPTFTSTLTIKHPRFSRDAVVVTEATIDTNLIKGKTTWEFEDQKVEYLGKIADESNRSEKRYVAEMEMRNPQSHLDIAYSGKLEKTREGYGLETEFKYMTSHDRQHKINSLRANINKIREEIKIDMTNPLTSVRVSGRRLMGDYESGIHRYSISAEKDGKTVRSELDVNARDLSIDFKTFSPSDDKFHIYAKYMNPSTIQMEAYHTESGNKIVDGVLSVRLNNSRLLHSRAHLRPTILEDLKMLLNKARSHDFNWIDATSQAIAKELRYKKHYMKALAKPFGAVSEELGSHISSAWSQIGRATGDLYRQNRFYVRDAHTAVQNSINVASENLSQKGREIQNSINKIVDSCKPTMDMMTQKVSNGYAQALDWAIVMTEDAKKNLAENYEAMAEFYNEIANTIREKIPELAKYGDMVTDKIKDAIDSARNHPKIKAVLEAMMELDMNAYFKPLKRWARQSSATTSKMVERFTEIMYRGQEMWHDFSSRPEFQEVKSYVVKAVKSSKWLYEYLEVEENVMAIVRDLYKNGLVTLKNQAWDIADDYLKFDKTRFTVWLPEQGEMQAEAYLPIELSDLKSWPQINLNLMQYWNQVRDIFKAYMPDKDWVVWDTFYKYKPSMDYKDWIPPFTSHATVSSSQHYMTFDKTFYEFAGECSYLLTKDFVDSNFSVLVNYDQVKGKMSKKSITVIADDKQLEISPDFKVQIDGKRTELPLEYGKTAVLRVGNMIKVINTNGFQVTCDLPHDRCTVSISGWYFGKVAGLMGTYDNEAATDLTTATNTLTSDISSFAQSWSIGPRCKAVNSAVKVPEFDSDSRYKRLCKQYFEDQTSMFRPCFRQVDPTPFMTMCMNDMPVDENRIPSEADTCKVGAFYVDECRRAGVPLRLPKECVRCEMPNGRAYYEGQNVTISEKEKTVPDSADVVFVVEHGPCNKELVKKMKLLINFYEKSMKKDKLKFVHYGLVGYGGKGVHYEPHSHTLDGELLNKRSSFLLGLDGFEFQNEKADVLAALHYAALYPFRTGVSKSIILLPCQACHEQSIRYADVQQLLLDRDIRLHTFIQDNFKLKSASKSPKSSYIIGVDFNEAYTTKDFKDKGAIEGDANLRKQVLVPKDICNALAMETDGSIWSAPQLTEGRKKIQKMFMDVHSRTVSLKAEPSDCQICECVSDEVGVGMSVCRSCEPRNPIDQLLEKVEKVEEKAAGKMPNKPNKKKNWREIKAMRQKRRRQQQQRKNN